MSLELHSADLMNRHKARTPSPLSLCRFIKSYESQTENPSVVVALATNLKKDLSLQDLAKPNRGNPNKINPHEVRIPTKVESP